MLHRRTRARVLLPEPSEDAWAPLALTGVIDDPVKVYRRFAGGSGHAPTFPAVSPACFPLTTESMTDTGERSLTAPVGAVLDNFGRDLCPQPRHIVPRLTQSLRTFC